MALTVTQPIILDETGEKIVAAIEEHTSQLTNIMNADVMVGASANVSGKSGRVPAPAAGQESAFLKGDGTWGSAEITQNYTTSASTFPILAVSTENASSTLVNRSTNFASTIKIQPSTGTVIANNFSGTASLATKALQDGAGNVIVDTYAKKSEIYKPEQVGGEELIWTLTSNYATGSTVTLPNNFQYPHSMKALRVSLDGAVMSLGVNYEEVISSASSAYSNKIKPLCDLKSGMVLHIWVAPISFSIAQFEDKIYGMDGNIAKAQMYAQTAEAAADAAESWLYAIQNSQALKGYLATSGGTMTGGITFDYSNAGTTVGEVKALPLTYKSKATSGAVHTDTPMYLIPTSESTDYGTGFAFGGCGCTMLGSGESITNYVKTLTLDGSTENTYITSDQTIKFVTGCNAIASRKESTIDAAGNFSLVGALTVAGTINCNNTITGTKVYNAVFNDYAEFFEKGEETEVGDIIAMDMSSDEERYIKATSASHIVGVHSDTYGHILGGDVSIEESEKTHIPVGLVGRVKTKIVGEIEKGDLVVLSDIPGVGRKYDAETDDKFDVIGFAIEGNSSKDIKLVKIKLRG